MKRALAGLLLLCGLAADAASQAPPERPPRPGRRVREREADVLLPPLPRPPRPHDFDAAKRLLESRVHGEGHRRELYCGCAYDAHKAIDFADCASAHPYTPIERHASRAGRMEWEHVVPASWIGRTMPCWSESTDGRSHRDHCRATDRAFAEAEGDLHDLLPSIGQLNALRDDDAYGEIPGEAHVGGCDFEVDPRAHRVEPRDAVRGDVARVTFYVAATYGVPLHAELYRTLVRWHLADPPDAAERRRNDLVEAIQGNRNPYVDGHDLPR